MGAGQGGSGLSSTRLAAVVGVAWAALLLWYGAIDPADPRWEAFDLHRYEAMRRAAPHLALVRQPEAFRLLGPFLAAVAGFRAVTWAALAGSAALLFRWLRGEGVSAGTAALAVVLFGLARQPVGQLVWNPYQAGDALGLFALLAALCAVQAGRWPLFAASLAAGVLARETPLLAVPPALFLAGRRAIPFCIPALLVFAAVRILVPHAGGMSPVAAAWYFLPGKLSAEAAARAALAFAPAVAVVLAAPRAPSLGAAGWALVLGTLASSLCGADVERLLLPMAPAVYLAIAREIEPWPARFRAALLACAAAGALHHEMGRVTLPGQRATLVVTLAASVAALLVAVAARWGMRAPRDGRDARAGS